MASIGGALALCSVLFAATAPAIEPARLSRDINRQPDREEHANPDELTTLEGVTYFRADDGLHGAELWRTAGTPASTQLVVDLAPGEEGAFPSSLTVFDGEVLFAAHDLSRGCGLWRSDGTAAGTRLVAILRPGSPCRNFGIDSGPRALTPAGARLFFSADDGVHGCELWVSDGTPDGTFLVRNINTTPVGLPFGPEDEGASPDALTPLAGGIVFRAARDGLDATLWHSDGTAEGTVPLAEISAYPPASDAPFPVIGGRALFFASAPQDPHLWRTDGTPAGTVPIAAALDLAYTMQQDGPATAVFAGALYYFLRDQHSPALTLWRSDGTAAGTRAVVEAIPGGSALGIDLVSAAPQMFFTAPTPAGAKLWRSTGTPASTRQVGDLVTGPSGPFVAEAQSLTAVGDAVVFVGTDGRHGCALWRSNGTAAGTTLLADPHPSGGFCLGLPGQNEHRPQSLTAIGGGRVLFAADDGVHGVEPWISDGTPGGTHLLADLNAASARTGGAFDLDACSVGCSLHPVGERVVFTATDGSAPGIYGSDGSEAGTARLIDGTGAIEPIGARALIATAGGGEGVLWASDGTSGGTVALHRAAGAPHVLGRVRGATALFRAGPSGAQELWRTAGTPAGTTRVLALDAAPPPTDAPPVPVDALVFFLHEHVATGLELWRSDGTTAGTAMVADLTPGPASSSFRTVSALVTRVAGRACFQLAPTGPSAQLWCTDGTAGGTERLVAAARSAAHVLDTRLLFAAADGAGRTGLWASDGTRAGTGPISPLDPAGALPPAILATLGARALYAATDEAHGRELWVTDGTVAGTRRLADIHPGRAASHPALAALLPGGVLFTAADEQHGRELWRSDGTEAGTALVRDIRPGPTSAFALPDGEMFGPGGVTLAGALVFLADDGEHGIEVWRSDGTAAGTLRLTDTDPRPPARGRHHAHFTRIGGRAIFSGFAADSGSEPWVTDGTRAGTVRLADVAPGPRSSRRELAAGPAAEAGGRLFFVADDGLHGAELWSVPLPASTCPGDCDDSGAVTVDELVRGVNIALGAAEPATCPALDTDGNDTIAIDELIAAVRAALDGCRPPSEHPPS